MVNQILVRYIPPPPPDTGVSDSVKDSMDIKIIFLQPNFDSLAKSEKYEEVISEEYRPLNFKQKSFKKVKKKVKITLDLGMGPLTNTISDPREVVPPRTTPNRVCCLSRHTHYIYSRAPVAQLRWNNPDLTRFPDTLDQWCGNWRLHSWRPHAIRICHHNIRAKHYLIKLIYTSFKYLTRFSETPGLMLSNHIYNLIIT